MHFQIPFYVFLLLSLEQISLPLRVCFRSFQQEIISPAKVHLAVLGEMFGCHGVCVYVEVRYTFKHFAMCKTASHPSSTKKKKNHLDSNINNAEVEKLSLSG